jgi:hypothetical protein
MIATALERAIRDAIIEVLAEFVLTFVVLGAPLDMMKAFNVSRDTLSMQLPRVPLVTHRSHFPGNASDGEHCDTKFRSCGIPVPKMHAFVLDTLHILHGRLRLVVLEREDRS